ncbi:transcription elongation factor A protein 1-like [Babylonia areolata]|uniref:transcription elongation factor A protein 1-like n=1 Tax=Babylonia areolata TaxID=304850 RepID=UPI003FD5CE85
MECTEEVLTIGKKIEKLISTNTNEHTVSLDLLKTLQDLPISLQILQKTKIGVTVNSLRKVTSSTDVTALSKRLIKNWKKLLPAEGSSHTGLNRRSSSSSSGDSTPGLSGGTTTTETAPPEQDKEAGACAAGDSTPLAPVSVAVGNNKENEKPETGSNNSNSSVSVPLSSSTVSTADEMNDPVRIKCRELLVSALRSGEMPEGGRDPDALAAEIELAIYQEQKSTDHRYKNRVRSRVSNLKDQRNPQLRQNVLKGLISSEEIASMSAEEMASDQMKELRARLTEEAIKDHQMTNTTMGTTTDLFRCKRCGNKNCTYSQLQTRSSDEPMTTFVLCNDCGKRWKVRWKCPIKLAVGRDCRT